MNLSWLLQRGGTALVLLVGLAAGLVVALALPDARCAQAAVCSGADEAGVNGTFYVKADTSFKGTFTHANTTDRVYTSPDITTTLAGLAATSTWTATQTFGSGLLVATDAQLTDSSLIGTTSLEGDLSPSQITGDQNNYNPTSLSTATILRLSTDATRTLTGLAGGQDGRVVTILNIGSNDIVLSGSSSSSSAGNRFSFAGNYTIGAEGGLTLIYDSTSSRWRITGAMGAGFQQFTGSGTWTKPSGIHYIQVVVIGAGGAGSGFETGVADAAGGGGAFVQRVFPASNAGSTESVTVGAGGSALGAAGAGTAGGTSSFGSHATAYGGGGGYRGSGGGAGTRGAGGQGEISNGGAAGAGTASGLGGAGASVNGGVGGASENGGSAGGSGRTSSGAGFTAGAVTFGAPGGGSGGFGNNNGAAGGAAVQGGGTAGAAGTGTASGSGTAGGAGGTGVCTPGGGGGGGGGSSDGGGTGGAGGNGGAPGGGGGSSGSGTGVEGVSGGNGARGEVCVWWW